MITEQPFLPLFFNTEDADLWGELQKLPAEKRSQVTKQALREFFQDHLDLNQASSEDFRVNRVETHESLIGLEEVLEEDKEYKQEILEHDENNDNGEHVVFSLESLFETSPAEAQPDPVKNLLSIIGEEEDEEVIRLFRRTNEKEVELQAFRKDLK